MPLSKEIKRGALAQLVKPRPLSAYGTYDLVRASTVYKSISSLQLSDVVGRIVEIQKDSEKNQYLWGTLSGYPDIYLFSDDELKFL